MDEKEKIHSPLFDYHIVMRGVSLNKRKVLTSFIGLIWVLAILCSCTVSSSYLKLKEQGYYPESAELPNTKWESDSGDIWFCIYDYGEDYIVGEYVSGDKTYRIIGSFWMGNLNFSIVSSVSQTASVHIDSNGKAFLQCEQDIYGFLETEYIYENGKLICTVKMTEGTHYKDQDIINFSKVSDMIFEKKDEFFCEELQSRISSFYDIDGYFKGEIILNGKNCPLQAIEVGNSNYYLLSIQNGIINNLISKSTSPLVYMLFQFEEDEIIVHVTDDHMVFSVDYPYWKKTESEFVFARE